jgi:hypothetical protein
VVTWTDLSERADETGEADNTAVSEQFGHLSYAPNVLLTVLGREPQILVETVTDVVAVKTVRWQTLSDQIFLKGKGYGCLSGTRQT